MFSAQAGAVGSKTARGPKVSHSQGLDAAISSEPAPATSPTPKAKPKKPRTSKSVPAGGDLPQSRDMSKEASGDRSPFLREIDNGKRPNLGRRQGSVDDLARRDGSDNQIFKGASYSPENSDGLRFFNRSSQFSKTSDFAKDTSSMSGKRFESKNFQFRTKPGLPELDMPPPDFFAEREPNLPMEKTATYAGTKARGYSKSSNLVRTYRGQEALKAERDLGKLNQALMKTVLSSDEESISLDDVPDRPLNIKEVKSLLNTHTGGS